MTAPVYSIVFHEGHWRIKFQNLHLGEYESAEAAAKAAFRICHNRLAPSNGIKITTAANGDINVGDPEDTS